MKYKLKERILKKNAHICIIGLGYVGLPLAIELGKSGFSITGVDHNASRVEAVNKGENYILDTNISELKELVNSKKLRAIKDFSMVKNIDIYVICVPTGLTKNLVPDLQHVISVAKDISNNLKKGQLICIESTIFPGTTEEIVLPILESTGLKAEKDFYLIHSPERIDPGNQKYSTKNISKIVGGVGPDSLELGEIFYSHIIEKVIPVSSVRVAELAKVHENTFRAINIALVNELAMLCDKMDISVWEVLDAAFTKPFGIMAFYPGPGVGGHCIPIDPHYLEWKAREYNFITKFIGAAGEINRKMPEFVREKVMRTLNKIGIAPSNSKILILGMAYKKDTRDYRESPVISLTEMLLKDGIDVSYHDPYVSQIDIASIQLKSVELNEKNIENANIVIIATDHSEIDYKWIVKTANKIIDTRNATKNILDREKNVILL
ncbi:nucleotide sugar dehydrogenase [Alkaliphilus peptidifermentans]|uniref:UDP-N-acetyl-D-glucosamine dehydrogenase n=1 Tax=Alkaliphilus peptidifermentans DSM 18978 TaxID=1120976 RepID=A0A1G5H1T8_9FIRM|nr:nucleotide sugar dehydrogenase [Alkaliphilus peptidifermentans]SCY57704.1 UDP-N-acetyl-D-glucosamine dehydrogenase [Alkaliphilus peptidifermentans DSM 18978]